jgi:hypothetical protein
LFSRTWGVKTCQAADRLFITHDFQILDHILERLLSTRGGFAYSSVLGVTARWLYVLNRTSEAKMLTEIFLNEKSTGVIHPLYISVCDTNVLCNIRQGVPVSDKVLLHTSDNLKEYYNYKMGLKTGNIVKLSNISYHILMLSEKGLMKEAKSTFGGVFQHLITTKKKIGVVGEVIEMYQLALAAFYSNNLQVSLDFMNWMLEEIPGTSLLFRRHLHYYKCLIFERLGNYELAKKSLLDSWKMGLEMKKVELVLKNLNSWVFMRQVPAHTDMIIFLD